MNKKIKQTQMPRQFDDGLPTILPPIEDLVFKTFFIKRVNLLSHMLRSIILPSDPNFFDGIHVINPEILPEFDGNKSGILDIKVTVTSGKIIDVEMQKEKFEFYRERVVTYLSGMVRNQLGVGEKYENVRRVISISIAVKPLIDDGAYHHRYTLYDPKTNSEFTDLIEVHIIELSKLPEDDDGSELWKWMKFINVKKEEELKMIAEMNPVMEEAAIGLREISEDQKTRERLLSIRRWEADRHAERVAAERRWEAERVAVEQRWETERVATEQRWGQMLAEKDAMLSKEREEIAQLRAEIERLTGGNTH